MMDIDDLLPKTLREIKEIFGLEVMLKIWQYAGNGHLHVTSKQIEPLTPLLGDSAKPFCEHFDGETLQIGKMYKVQMALRNELIKEAIAGGEKLMEIGRRFDLTENQVSKIGRGVANKKQKDLFS